MVSKLLKILALGAFLTLNLNARTIKEGVLTIATEGTYAPFSYYDDKNELNFILDRDEAEIKKLEYFFESGEDIAKRIKE